MEKKMIEHYKDSKKSEFRFIKNRWRNLPSGHGHGRRHGHAPGHGHAHGHHYGGAGLRTQLKQQESAGGRGRSKTDKYLKVVAFINLYLYLHTTYIPNQCVGTTRAKDNG